MSNKEIIERSIRDYENKTLLYPPFTSSKLRRGHKGFLGALFCAVGMFGRNNVLTLENLNGFFREGMKAYIKGYREVLSGEVKTWVVQSSFDTGYINNITGGMFNVNEVTTPTYPVLVAVDFDPTSIVLQYTTEDTESVFRFDSLFGLYDPADKLIYFFVEPYNFTLPVEDATINSVTMYELALTDKGLRYAE